MEDQIPLLFNHGSYDHDVLKTLCDKSSEYLGLSGSFSGRVVLLKPNLISGRAKPLACTDARFVKAIAEWFVDKGARVLIGDSPAFGSGEQVLNKQGIADAIKALPVEIIEFKNSREHYLSHDVKVGISEQVLSCDLLVNLPRIKAHSQMYVTIAVKNFYGIVCGMQKAMCHMRNGSSHLKFADLMLDLTSIVPESVSIVDGIDIMHKQGPVNGELLKWGCFCAGKDPVAVDTALLAALQLEHKQCPVWLAADRRDLPGSRIDNCCFPHLSPDKFFGSGFVAPSLLNPVPFNPFRFMVSSFRRAIGGMSRGVGIH